MSIDSYVYKSESDKRAEAFIQNQGEHQEQVYDRFTQMGREVATAVSDQVKKIDGTKIGLPQEMTKSQAAAILSRDAEAESEPFRHARLYKVRPWDGAVCTMQALQELFGPALTAARNQNAVQEVPIDAHGGTIAVPVGKLELLWAGAKFGIEFQIAEDDKIGMAHVVIFTAIAKHAAFLVGLSKHLEEFLRLNSIYRGKAITLSMNETFPEFTDPWSVPAEKIIYNQTEYTALYGSVIGRIEKADKLRSVNLPVTRQVLLEGEYGVGKTLALKLIAQACNSNGWTFIQAKTGEDNLESVLSFAQLYAPCYVAIEDVDHLTFVQNDSDGKKLSRVLQEFDGASTKGREIGLVMTTNHWEADDKFPTGMKRPGRIDRPIHLSNWDEEAFGRGLRSQFGEAEIMDVDTEAVYASMADMTPAFIISILQDARCWSILRTDEVNQSLATEDFLSVAAEHRTQWDAYKAALQRQEERKVPAIEQAMTDLNRKVLRETMKGAYVEDTGPIVLAEN